MSDEEDDQTWIEISWLKECLNCGNITATENHCFVCCLVENCEHCAFIEAEINEMMEGE